MQKIIEKAAILIEAMPYFQRFKGETVVVKFGGSIMEDRNAVASILKDVAFMACVGLRPVLVHGGGKAISKSMKDAGLPTVFVQGLRVTDEESMRVVEHVLNHEVNPTLVRILESFNCQARGIHGDDLITTEKLAETDNETGKILDWGYVGRVTKVDIAPVEAFLQSGITPVVTPLGRGEDKKLYNVNADAAAVALAEGLKARKLVFLSDVPGVLEDPSKPETLFSSIRVQDVEGLVKRGIIRGGMLPKIHGGVAAIKCGVRKTHIIDSSVMHSLLLELFTDKGIGTEIIP